MTGQAITPNPSDAHLRGALLPWESEDAFEHLADQWRATYSPQGPAEAAPVNQLIWIDWRRQRVRLSERALHVAQLYARSGITKDYGTSDGLVKRALACQTYRLRKYDSRTAIATDRDDDRELAAYAEDVGERTRKALEVIDAGGTFADTIAYLEEDTLEWWDDEQAGDDARFSADARGLRNFIEMKLLPWLEGLGKEASERPEVRVQAHGESLNPARLGVLYALDERLTRQFEKTLAMLIKLQDLRARDLPPPNQTDT